MPHGFMTTRTRPRPQQRPLPISEMLKSAIRILKIIDGFIGDTDPLKVADDLWRTEAAVSERTRIRYGQINRPTPFSSSWGHLFGHGEMKKLMAAGLEGVLLSQVKTPAVAAFIKRRS